MADSWNIYLNRHGEYQLDGDGICDSGHFVNESDARKAAAAPLMLETLEKVGIPDGYTQDSIWALIVETINVARGR